jgi:hypothetical protein
MSILHNLLQKVNSTPVDSAELDKDIIAAFPTAFDGITKSIDAIVRLIETELAGGGNVACPPSALVGQIRQIEEGSVSGSS